MAGIASAETTSRLHDGVDCVPIRKPMSAISEYRLGGFLIHSDSLSIPRYDSYHPHFTLN